MDKYFEHQKVQSEKFRKEKEEEEKREGKLCELFEYLIPKVFRHSESLQKEFEFRNERKTFGDDFAEFKSDVVYFIEYDVKDENNQPIVVEEHIYTLSINITDDYLKNGNMILTLIHENGAAPSEFCTNYTTINEKGFEDALSEVFIRMEKHRFR